MKIVMSVRVFVNMLARYFITLIETLYTVSQASDGVNGGYGVDNPIYGLNTSIQGFKFDQSSISIGFNCSSDNHSVFGLINTTVEVDRVNIKYNSALSEFCLMVQLCNCRNENMDWCFVHNTVNTKHVKGVKSSKKCQK